MKNLTNKIFFLITILLIIFSLSCYNDDKPPCGRIDPGIVPVSPYNSPIWHPSGQFIGFNYTPLKRITYPDSEEYWGYQEFAYDSTGFWLINPDGSDMRRIFPHTLQTPEWSPDGEWIVFVPDAQIFKMRFTGETFDTTTITQLTSVGRNFFPAWSPDGQWIAHDRTYSYPETPDVQGIWLLKSLDGSDRTKISTGRFPDWSPDGNNIIFIGFHSEIYRVNISDTTKIDRLTSLNQVNIYATDNCHPRYSPDGKKIAFWSSGNLCVMDTTGSNQHQLTTREVDASFGLPFSWSPTGAEIVYTRYSASDWTYDNGVLWIMNAATGEEIQLTFNSEP